MVRVDVRSNVPSLGQQVAGAGWWPGEHHLRRRAVRPEPARHGHRRVAREARDGLDRHPGDADAQLRADRARHEVAVWRACSDVYGDESLVMPAY